MDYENIFISGLKNQTVFISQTIGPYDKLMIQYLYYDLLNNNNDSNQNNIFEKIIIKNITESICYIIGDDKQKNAGMDPTVQIWDLSHQPLYYLKWIMTLWKNNNKNKYNNNNNKNINYITNIINRYYFYPIQQLLAYIQGQIKIDENIYININKKIQVKMVQNIIQYLMDNNYYPLYNNNNTNQEDILYSYKLFDFYMQKRCYIISQMINDTKIIKSFIIKDFKKNNIYYNKSNDTLFIYKDFVLYIINQLLTNYYNPSSPLFLSTLECLTKTLKNMILNNYNMYNFYIHSTIKELLKLIETKLSSINYI